jgi:hypothetical protein
VVVPPQVAAAVDLAVKPQGEKDKGEDGEEPEDEVELRAKIFMCPSVVGNCRPGCNGV